MAEVPSAPTVDAAALRHLERRLHRGPDEPWLHGEIARRMAQRLPLVKAVPQVVVDASVPFGSSHARLLAAYPQARWIGVCDDGAVLPEEAPLHDAVPPPAAPAPPPAGGLWSRWRRGAAAAAATPAAPRRPAAVPIGSVPDGAAGLVWANLGLATAAQPAARLAQWLRVLQVDGFLMFSALGPGSLAALQRLYRDAGWPPPLAPFVDMHDWGDALVHAGFADPVMDQETVTLTWRDGHAALADLRRWGGNAHPRRFAGLRTPRWRERLAQALHGRASGADGRVALALEFVYGHAFKAAPRLRVAAETRVEAAQLQALARRGRPAR